MFAKTEAPTRAYVAVNRAEEHPPSKVLVGIQGLDQFKLELNDRRVVLLSNRYYDLPLGWRLSARTRKIIDLQSGRYWDCVPNLHLEQSDPNLSNADCVQQLVSYDLDERMQDAARIATIVNYRTLAPSIKYKPFEECYRAKLGGPRTLLQFRSIEALLSEWDRHPELHQDPRWLAYVLATVQYETGDMLPREELGTIQNAEEREGYTAPLGRELGNIRPGDGGLYRARGFIQLAGRYNYTHVGAGIGINLETYPDLVSNPVISAQAAFEFLFLGPAGNKLAKYINSEKADFVDARSVISGRPSSVDNTSKAVATIAEEMISCAQEIGR